MAILKCLCACDCHCPDAVSDYKAPKLKLLPDNQNTTGYSYQY